MLQPAPMHVRHPTRSWMPTVVCAIALALLAALARGDDTIEDLLQAAKPATAPATLTSPTAPQNKPTSDALGTIAGKPPAGSRLGTIVLSNGIKLEGRVWTTVNTPLRLWIEETRSYRDIDLALVKRIDVHVLTETMEEDWRWLKEGSDQKVYSGKKYPNVSLAYKFTLVNEQQIEGTIVAAVYFADGAKARTLALYKIYKGSLDETLKDLVYITSITLDAEGASAVQEQTTTKLPLLDD